MKTFWAEFLAAICAAFFLHYYFEDKPAEQPAPLKVTVQAEQSVPVEQRIPVQRMTPVEQKDFLANGQFKVGTDLSAGEYLAIGMGYVEVARNSSGNVNSILINDNIVDDTQRYIVANEGEYVKLIGDIKLYPAANAPKLNTSNGLPSGQFKVGVDIPAGEYKITLEAGGYFAVTRDTRCAFVKNQFTNEGGSFYATVADGQYLQIKKGIGQFVGTTQ